MAQEELQKVLAAEKAENKTKYISAATIPKQPSLPKAIDEEDTKDAQLTNKTQRDALATRLGRTASQPELDMRQGRGDNRQKPKPQETVTETTTQEEWDSLAEFANQYKQTKGEKT